MTSGDEELTETATHGRRAVIELRDRIVRGELPGGMRLYEVPMSEELSMSRTPVREALSRLVEEGLLDRLPNGGFVVRRFTRADVIDLMELRGVLEGAAARRAAERGVPPERLSRMRQLVADLDDCFGEDLSEVDIARYSQLNQLFHMELANLSGSDILRRELERVKVLPFASPTSFLPVDVRFADVCRSLRISQAQHHAIVSAIAGREGSRAEAVAREHAFAAKDILAFVLENHPELRQGLPGLSLVVG